MKKTVELLRLNNKIDLMDALAKYLLRVFDQKKNKVYTCPFYTFFFQLPGSEYGLHTLIAYSLLSRFSHMEMLFSSSEVC